MTRYSLIISNPGTPGAQNYCAGVLVDVREYTAFLTSPLGGAWFDSEIVCLDRPTVDDVLRKVDVAKSVDYSLVIFVGHGYYCSRRKSTIVELRPGVELDSMELRSGTTRRSIILDCCRKRAFEDLSESRSSLKFAAAKPLSTTNCRIVYDNIAMACSKGILVAFGCSIDETCGDQSSRGGYYSSSLIGACRTWYEDATSPRPGNYKSLSVVEAHDLAVPLVNRLSGGTQNPEIEKSRTGPYFPFAVMA